MRDRSWLWALAALAAFLGLALVLGMANPLPPPRISTDTLGPDGGEPTGQYLQRAAESLRDSDAGIASVDTGGVGTGSESTEPRWGLVSFVDPSTPAVAAAAVGGVRISEVLFWSPSAGAQSPLVTVSTAASEDPAALLRRAQEEAANQLAADASVAALEDVRATVVADLREGCPCVVGVLVRAPLDQLRAIADDPGVRAAEALPADAIFGRFAVRALLPPQQP